MGGRESAGEEVRWVEEVLRAGKAERVWIMTS